VEVDVAQAHTELWAAIGAVGQDYPRFRDRLVARGDPLVPFLKERTQQAESWQEKVMAAIVLERIVQAEQIKAVVAWWSTAPRPSRSWLERWREMGKSLAERAALTPMVLVEKIWKGNELVNSSVPAHEQGAWAADALGWLGERRALYPLIELLKADYDPRNTLPRVATAARALGKLRDPRGLPALCKVFALYAEDNTVAVPALDAIVACADRHHIGVIEGYARSLRKGETRDSLEAIVHSLRKGPLPKQ
jgi:hypothetical protein